MYTIVEQNRVNRPSG